MIVLCDKTFLALWAAIAAGNHTAWVPKTPWSSATVERWGSANTGSAASLQSLNVSTVTSEGEYRVEVRVSNGAGLVASSLCHNALIVGTCGSERELLWPVKPRQSRL